MKCSLSEYLKSSDYIPQQDFFRMVSLLLLDVRIVPYMVFTHSSLWWPLALYIFTR
jgi:hypothetical protein